MRKILLSIVIFCLSACASPEQQMRTILDRLEWQPCEYGEFELEGNLDFNPLPLLTSNVHMKLYKNKPQPAEEVSCEEKTP